MRQLTAFASYLDNLGAPLVGRARFCNMDKSPAVVYGLDNGQTPRYVPIGSTVYTNSSGQLVPQVFLDDHDYLIFFDKYIGGGTMSEDDDPESWPEQGSAVDKYNTVGIELDGGALRTAETISSLRSLIPANYPADTNEIVTLLGYNTKGDKPEINYIWNAYSNEEDNGGSIIKVNDIATGRWVLVDCPRYLDVRHFGAFPNQASDRDDVQCGRIQLAGSYSHSNNCGLYFYGDSLNAYYDISGLTLYDINSDDDAMVFAMNGTESTLHDVVNIHCATNQYTEVADQGKINLYGETLKTSFAPRYNVWFGNDSKSVRTIIDSDVETSHLEIWDVIVEVTVPTTSHWVFVNTPIESVHRIGNNVAFRGVTRLARSMFRDNNDGMDFSTITISSNGIVIDIDDFKYDTAAWCKLVKQQPLQELDIKGYTLNSNCNLNFNSGNLVLHNAVLDGFSCNIGLTLKNCRGSISYGHYGLTLNLEGCSNEIVLTSIAQGTTINSWYSDIRVNSDISVERITMLGGHILSASNTVNVSERFEAIDTKVFCAIDCGNGGNGQLSLNGCVVIKNVAGKAVSIIASTLQNANVTAYSPYSDSSQNNEINAEIVGNKFLGSSLFKVRRTYSSGSSTVYSVNIDMSGNNSDHDFFDDTDFANETHTVVIGYFAYKGNYGGCPVESKTYVTTVDYDDETLSYSGTPGDNRVIPSGQPNNSLRLYKDERAEQYKYVTWWCLKMNYNLTLSSANIFQIKNLNMTPFVVAYPTCKFGHLTYTANQYTVNQLPMPKASNSIGSRNQIDYQSYITLDITPNSRFDSNVVSKWARIEWQLGIEGYIVGT